MLIDPDLEKALSNAFSEALKRRHEFITLEHILYCLVDDKLAIRVLSRLDIDIKKLKSDLENFLNQKIPSIPESVQAPDPQYSLGAQFVLQTAAAHVQSSGKTQVRSSNVLVAMFREKESFAVYYLLKHGVTRYDLVKIVSHGMDEEENHEMISLDSGEKNKKKNSKNFLEKYCTDLNEKAREGRIDPLIGRNYELDRVIHILARRRKNNPILVGEAGVGKTAIAEGLALKIETNEAPTILENSRIYSLDMGTLLAGTKFRGEFEERLKGILKAVKNKPNIILFIDEIHTIIGAGAVSGGSLDASNLLKPALANGEIRCIGTTTYKEYRQLFEKDHALSRRFQKVDINEPSIEDSLKILKGLKSKYEDFHKIKYSDSSLEASVNLSSKHITDRFLPDKAIDVMDEVGAEVKLKSVSDSTPKVTVKDVENMVSRIAKIPSQNVKLDDKKRLKNLDRDLKLLIYGQDQAIDQIVESIRLSRSGLKEDDKTIGSFLFAGPTGVGKTELAKQLAKNMGIEFLRFDMSEYMEKHTVSRLIGSPPGYVGYDQGGQLTDAIYKHPHAVLLLDEIEKAHEDIFNILLQIMDHATLTDNNGRKSDFRHVVLIMTTNSGARESQTKTIGFEKQSFEDKSLEVIKKQFSPEFRNRLNAIVKFNSLSLELVEQIVDKEMANVEERLKSKNITLDLTENARKYIAKNGYEPEYGARPIKRLIEKEISQKLSHEILFGELEKGGSVEIDADKELTFKFQSHAQARKSNSKKLEKVSS